MIKVILNPNQISLGKLSEILIEITNTGVGVCTNIQINLKIPVSILLIKGNRRISITRLGSGETYTHPLTLQSRQPGTNTIEISELSYRDPDGITKHVSGKSLKLDILSVDRIITGDRIRLQVSLSEKGFRNKSWDLLKGVVTNRSDRTVQELVMHLEGPGTYEPTRLLKINPGKSIPFALSIRPTQRGVEVPYLLKIVSSSGSILFSGQIYLRVDEDDIIEEKIAGVTIRRVDKLVIPQSERSTVVMEQEVRKEKVIEIGANASVSAPVVIADSIENSFNALAESGVEDNVKTMLEELLKAVNQVNKEVPPEQEEAAEEMARDAETLVKEATSSNPRRKWYEVSI
jgi:hypothetical protein